VVRVTVNGVGHEVPDGSNILAGLRGIDIDVPALCDDPRLTPVGACRVCVVDVAGHDRPVAACTTPVEDAMEIETHSPRVEGLRRELLRMLASDYPRDAVDAAPTKPFHALLERYGVRAAVAPGAHIPRDDAHPYIRVDMNQCITCFRCVRICEDVQGQFTWRVWNRGSDTRIVPDSHSTLLESSCVSCGACVDTCPTGALEDRSVLELGVADRWTRTTCPYCGVGCELEAGTRGGRLVASRPALDAPVNRGHLCSKGRYAHAYVHAPDRVTEPLVRAGDDWNPVSWSEALEFVATELRRVLGRHGPGAVGVLGSARATNEENYLAQKFARIVLGTNNVDSCARVCHAPTAAAMGQMLGTGAATNSYDDIEEARTIFVFGSNTTENHPIVGARIKQAALRGANLVVVDPRAIELAEYADLYLPVRPGTNVLLLNSLANVVVAEGLVDEEFASERLDGIDDFRAFTARFEPDRVAEECGVDAASIRAAARLVAEARPAMFVHGLGATEHMQGTEGVMAIVNLALLTGNVGRPGAGVNPLRGQNNVQGAAHMGCEPHRLTGYVPIDDGRERFESVWGAPVPERSGLDAMEMVDAAAAGALKALWIIGWDVLLTNPGIDATSDALGRANLVVVQDLFLNETAREQATVFLPAAGSFEKDGTFMNSERRIQRVRRAVDPVGESKPDWEILCRAAAAFGWGEQFGFDSAAAVWEEIRQVWEVGAGISYDRLDAGGGLQWPCPNEDHPGTAILHRESFPRIGKRATLRRIEPVPSSEVPTAEYPFILVTGRGLYQFNAGTMTMRTPNAVLRPTDTVEVAPGDAAVLQLAPGQLARVASRYGHAILPVDVNARVTPGQVFATFSDPPRRVNQVIGPDRDPYTHTPQYKVTAVRLEAISDTEGEHNSAG
jgi:formate dehydrogenase major subunit